MDRKIRGIKLLEQPERPLCEKCQKKPTRKMNKTVLGFHSFARFCYECDTQKRIARTPYLRHKKEICEECGFIPVHLKQLEGHHKDGNHKNNHVENIATLCANCHRLKHATTMSFVKNRYITKEEYEAMCVS